MQERDINDHATEGFQAGAEGPPVVPQALRQHLSSIQAPLRPLLLMQYFALEHKLSHDRESRSEKVGPTSDEEITIEDTRHQHAFQIEQSLGVV